MADTIQELMVRVEPEGVKETTQELGNQREEFTEMADTAEDSTGKLETFSARWAGAMRTFTAGLAIATAGLASRLPIVGELLSGMGGILEALAFKLDQALRPALTGVRETLFKTQGQIAEAEGALGGLTAAFVGTMDAVTELQSGLFETFTGIDVTENPILEFWFKLASLNVGALAADAVGAIQTIRDEGFSGFGRNILQEFNLEDEFLELHQTGVDLIGAIIEGAESKLNDVISIGENIPKDIASGIDGFLFRAKFKAADLGNRVQNNITDKIDQAKDWGAGIPQDIADGIDNKISQAQTKAKNLADDIADEIPTLDEAKQWGKDLVDGIIQGLQDKATELGNAVEQHIAQVIRDRLPGSDAETGPLSDLSTAGPSLVETVAGGMEQASSRAGSAADTVADAADPRAGGGFQARRETRPTLVMDGRELTAQDGRYRRDQTARRGRDG